ncbi:MAG TPA: serine hydrolase domain-containing protein [Gemmatimonadales bacterium]|nr:serine hydrolase domain-containing protein [Gemmatimonadales bacterium]
MNRRALPWLMALLVSAHPLAAQGDAAAGQELGAAVDSVAREVLKSTGVPSASVAVVRNGQMVYAQAYGMARLEPETAARPEMRYSIGSISKQFAAAAVLLLQQEGKLSLDDRVSRWLPDLTRARDVTVRELLSHTSGYQDYWPQDYVPPAMLQPTTAAAILDQWARKPLDFEPGSRWQYSNTNYVIAGLIVERVSGMPFFEFIRRRILIPLGMQSVVNIDLGRLPDSDPTGYMRYALGPLHPAPKEGPGWLFAAGELAMTPADLAKWDIAMMNASLLSPASYRTMETEVLLTNGTGTGYGLGVDVGMDGEHRLISHGGEVSGFTASNLVYPDDHVAVVVLTNQDAASAAGVISRRISGLLFASHDSTTHDHEAEARGIFEGLQKGTLDRSLFTANGNAYFSDQAIADFASSLGPLGPIKSFVQTYESLRGGMRLRVYRVTLASQAVRVWTFELPNGKLEQYQVATQN